jgi:hypothetical protein
MSIRDVIVAVNHMEADGVIERYAIGGAVGATFYVEPVATLDIDLFVTFRAIGESVLLPLQPIYDYLMARGASMKGEYVLIAGWPVQFLPPTGHSSRRRCSMPLKRTLTASLRGSSHPSISPQSPFRLAVPKTKRGCCSSSRKGRSTDSCSRRSFSVTISIFHGRGFNDNSSQTRDDHTPAEDPR